MRDGVWLFDDGEKYYWEENEMFQEINYGSFIIKLAYIQENHNSAAIYNLMNKPQKTNTIEENIDFLVEFILNHGLNKEVKEMLDIIEKNILSLIIATELFNIGIHDKQKLQLSIFENQNLVQNLESILLGEDLQEGQLNELLRMDKLESVSQIINGVCMQAYHVKSLGQLISLEITNILQHRNSEIIYRRCKVCKKIFIDKHRQGRPMEYCNYSYGIGACAKEGQKIINDRRSPIENQKNKIEGRLKKTIERRGISYEKVYGWSNEFKEFHENLISKNILENEYIEETEKWWANKKKLWKKSKK